MSTGMVHTVRQTVWNSLETWTKVVHVRREHRWNGPKMDQSPEARGSDQGKRAV